MVLVSTGRSGKLDEEVEKTEIQIVAEIVPLDVVRRSTRYRN